MPRKRTLWFVAASLFDMAFIHALERKAMASLTGDVLWMYPAAKSNTWACAGCCQLFATNIWPGKLTFLLQYWRMFDVELISKLGKALLKHGHQIISMLTDYCHDRPPDANAVSQASA
jgi:hypothetical protein